MKFRKEAIFLNGFSGMRLESGNFNVNSIKGEVFEVGYSWEETGDWVPESELEERVCFSIGDRESWREFGEEVVFFYLLRTLEEWNVT